MTIRRTTSRLIDFFGLAGALACGVLDFCEILTRAIVTPDYVSPNRRNRNAVERSATLSLGVNAYETFWNQVATVRPPRSRLHRVHYWFCVGPRSNFPSFELIGSEISRGEAIGAISV